MHAESKIVLGYGHKWPEGEGLVRENFPIWAVMRGRGILWRVRSRIEKEFAPSSWACDFDTWSAPDFQVALEIIQDCYQSCPDPLLAQHNQANEITAEQAELPAIQKATNNRSGLVETTTFSASVRKPERDIKPKACIVCKSTRGTLVLFKQIGRGVWAHEDCFHRHYRMITRGPRKGEWIWKHNWKKKKELAIYRKNVATGLTSPVQIEPLNRTQSELGVATWVQGVGELLGICLLLFLPYLLLIVVINFLGRHNLGWLVLPIFLVDALGAIFYRRANRPRKHIPFFWIFR